MSDAEFQIPEANLRELWKTPGNRLTNFKIIPMTGVELIAQKRLDQKVKHGHSIKSDYEAYPDFELMDAAQAIMNANVDAMPKTWDKDSCQKLCDKPLVERLIIAGAMIAAQIDVLNFKEDA